MIIETFKIIQYEEIYIFIVLVVWLCCCVCTTKSTFTVSGQVFDDLDMPVPGASVLLRILREWELSRILTVNFL